VEHGFLPSQEERSRPELEPAGQQSLSFSRWSARRRRISERVPSGRELGLATLIGWAKID
jgi:hypothetical protein